MYPPEVTAARDYGFHRQTLTEEFSPAFLARTRALNHLVADSGEVIEGGIFYWNLAVDFHDLPPDPSLASARRNYWRAARHKKMLLEVGVNAGHSALLALSSNPELIYYGVDMCFHAYTQNCVNYLAEQFPGRVFFLRGDSREVLPQFAARHPNHGFDLFNVDGGHTAELCRTDISNCLRIAGGSQQAHLLLDDIDVEWIFDIYCEFVSLGYLSTETFFGDWEDTNRNVFSKITPRAA
jgi:hypothetical protein